MPELNRLERAVIQRLLERVSVVLMSTVDYSAIQVVARDFRGCGFTAEFEQDEETLKLFDDSRSEIISSVTGAKLGVSETDCIFVFYIKNGQLTDLEGATYGGDDWPEDSTEKFSLYDIDYLPNRSFDATVNQCPDR